MADKTPVRVVFNASNVATGLAEFQSGDTVGTAFGGTGLTSIGSAGSGSNTGSHEVEHFDAGGKPMSALARQANPVKKMLNLIGALQDPYGQFRKCNTEKRLVE